MSYPILAVVMLSVCSISAVHVNKCKGGLGSRVESHGMGSLEDVRVNDCSASPCNLRKGSEATIEFDFIPDRTYESLTTSVFGGIGILRVPFREVHGKDACQSIKRKGDGLTGCPVVPTEVYTYSTSFEILKAYPTVSVGVQYGLYAGKTQVVCFSLPAKITN